LKNNPAKFHPIWFEVGLMLFWRWLPPSTRRSRTTRRVRDQFLVQKLQFHL